LNANRDYPQTEGCSLKPSSTLKRFDFGKNWAHYAQSVTDKDIRTAEAGLLKLLPNTIPGSSVLDIGCGSGIHTLCFLQLGCKAVTAIDYDPLAVRTAEWLVTTRYSGKGRAEFYCADVLDLPSHLRDHQFDIVYCWGVLHHTGDLWRALDLTLQLVRPGGSLVLAIYHRTPLCPVWKFEKRLYARAPHAIQALARFVYITTYHGARALSRRGEKRVERGMHASTDLHDWMGGYPYESASPQEIRRKLNSAGFTKLLEFIVAPPAFGIWGSGCDEYVYQAPAVPAAS
jgi:SAM-dependent methyltransferase